MKNQELKGKIRAKGFTQKSFSLALGISPASLSRKLAGTHEFTIGEIEQMKELLGLSAEEAVELFFTR
ncbi:MAG TPA: DUF739 family protein [Tissierellia bacterium]|jgi:transcriptional regulator with XRE-family HTH domain|nr:DUF739 family protein [Tissierellia bacterium]